MVNIVFKVSSARSSFITDESGGMKSDVIRRGTVKIKKSNIHLNAMMQGLLKEHSGATSSTGKCHTHSWPRTVLSMFFNNFISTHFSCFQHIINLLSIISCVTRQSGAFTYCFNVLADQCVTVKSVKVFFGQCLAVQCPAFTTLS